MAQKVLRTAQNASVDDSVAGNTETCRLAKLQAQKSANEGANLLGYFGESSPDTNIQT